MTDVSVCDAVHVLCLELIVMKAFKFCLLCIVEDYEENKIKLVLNCIACFSFM